MNFIGKLKRSFNGPSQEEIEELYPRWLKALEMGYDNRMLFESHLEWMVLNRLWDYHNDKIRSKKIEDMKRNGAWLPKK